VLAKFTGRKTEGKRGEEEEQAGEGVSPGGVKQVRVFCATYESDLKQARRVTVQSFCETSESSSIIESSVK